MTDAITIQNPRNRGGSTGHVLAKRSVTFTEIRSTPGPNMLHILGRSVGLGFRGSVPAMAGCLLAMLLVLTASAAGLSALLHSSPMLFEVLRYLGVAYLAWLGLKAWRDSCRPAPPVTVDATPPVAASLGAWKVFRGGLLVGLSNPKLLLFAAAFLPQFVDPSRGQALQYSVLVATFAACELFWYVMYAAGGHGLRRWLAKPFARRWFERLVGSVFLAFAVALLRFRPR